MNNENNYNVNITKIAGRILSLQEHQISYFLPFKKRDLLFPDIYCSENESRHVKTFELFILFLEYYTIGSEFDVELQI